MRIKRNKKSGRWKLTDKQITELILHVGDHAGAQGHARQKLEYLQSCSRCYELMKKLFPDKW